MTVFPRLIPSDVPGEPSAFTFDTWLAHSLTALVAGVAPWTAHRDMPRIPGSLPASPRLIVGVAVWSISVLAIVSGALGLAGPGGTIGPLAMVIGGALGLSTLSLRFRRTTEAMGQLRIDTRALGAALAVGIAVGFAQAIPLMLLPVVFEYPLRYGTLFAIVAIAPFAIALFLVGPIAGILTRRFGPRSMMSAGTLFSGIATTVRTAIVFASTPRGLPASAAAINEASVGLGSRLGIVVATTALTMTALGSARGMVVGNPNGEVLVDEFRVALVSLGTPRFREVYQASLEGAEPIKRAAYGVAYMDGVVAALIISGVVGVVGALLAWVLIGRRDPLHTVFDMQDERFPGDRPGTADGPALS